MNKLCCLIYCVFCISYAASSQLPVAGILVGNNPHLCPGTCTDFINASTNATSYQWFFTGASPSTSTDVDPVNICYGTPGNYDVQLIAINSFGSDTLLLSNFVIVFPLPPQIAIEYCGDTIFATQGFASYQWYFNGTIINGATDISYVRLASGDYNVVATDVNGCQVEAVIFNNGGGTCNCCTRINEFPSENTIYLFPNPASSTLTIMASQLIHSSSHLKIFNLPGETVFAGYFRNQKSEMSIDISELSPGIYFVQISSAEKIYNSKFVKQ